MTGKMSAKACGEFGRDGVVPSFAGYLRGNAAALACDPVPILGPRHAATLVEGYRRQFA
jgi:hypothetical protein